MARVPRKWEEWHFGLGWVVFACLFGISWAHLGNLRIFPYFGHGMWANAKIVSKVPNVLGDFWGEVLGTPRRNFCRGDQHIGLVAFWVESVFGISWTHLGDLRHVSSLWFWDVGKRKNCFEGTGCFGRFWGGEVLGDPLNFCRGDRAHRIRGILDWGGYCLWQLPIGFGSA